MKAFNVSLPEGKKFLCHALSPFEYSTLDQSLANESERERLGCCVHVCVSVCIDDDNPNQNGKSAFSYPGTHTPHTYGHRIPQCR